MRSQAGTPFREVLSTPGARLKSELHAQVAHPAECGHIVPDGSGPVHPGSDPGRRTPPGFGAVRRRRRYRRVGWGAGAPFRLDQHGGSLPGSHRGQALLSGLYLTLAVTGDIPWWLVGLIFGRDLLILAAAGLALLFTRLRAFPPSLWGKVSTIFQVLTAVAWMARNVTQSGVVEALAAALIWPTAAMTIWSGFHYGWRGFRMLRMH